MKQDKNLDKEVLFYRYCAGIASHEEKELTEKIVAGSREDADELRGVMQTVSIKNRIREMEAYDISKGYLEVRKKIRYRKRRKRVKTVLLRTAAILALPLLISTITLGYMVFNNYPEEEVPMIEIESAPGLVSRFELPDKSKVWLNSGSVLKYPVHFHHSVKEVELNGEGYFEVKSDKKQPFFVHTGSGIKIMAYGTRFNVNSTEESVETVLAEGKVAILLRNKALQELAPGEQSLFDMKTHKLEISNVNVYEKTAWKDGKMVFRNAPLSEVFERLSRRYNVDIILHDKHNLADKYSARVTFTDETIQQIFTYLEVAAPIKWELSSPVQNNDSTLIKQRINVWLIKK